ncbi:hypothetical protein B0H13DRAFT_2672347 [Mycena leptocephala]|nr:hypothetical protein B0H13DRAFT_2672347 [Mycena leptocephala]
MRRNLIFVDIFSVLTRCRRHHVFDSHNSDSDQLTSACTPSMPPLSLSLAPTSAACHAHTHHVRQRPRTSTQLPPPPYTFAPTSCSRHGVECAQTRLCPSTVPLTAADRISTCLGCAHRSPRSNDVVPRGNWAAWVRTAMRFIRVALVIYGSTALDRASLASLRRVHFAYAVSTTPIRASVSEAPANPGMDKVYTSHVLLLPDHLHFHNVFVAAQPPWNARSAHVREAKASTSSFDALLNAQRLYTTLVYPRAEPKPRLHPSLHPRVDLPACRVSTMRLGSSNPLPHPTTLLPQHLQRGPAHSPLSPQATMSRSGPHAQNMHAAYNELVASATPTTSRPHPPPHSCPPPSRAIMILRPKPSPRAGPVPFHEHPYLERAGDVELSTTQR